MKRLLRGLLLVAFCSPLAVGTAAAADAQPVGTLTFSPATGLDSMSLTVVSSNVCPATPASNVQLMVTGSGFPTDTNVTPNLSASVYSVDPATGGYDVPLQDSLRDFAAEQSPPATLSGRYDFSLVCRSALGKAVYASYTGSLSFSSPTHYRAVSPSDGAVVPTPSTPSTPSTTGRVAQSPTPTPLVTAARKSGSAPSSGHTVVPPTHKAPRTTVAAAATSRQAVRALARPTLLASRSSRAALAGPRRAVTAAAQPGLRTADLVIPSPAPTTPRTSLAAVDVLTRRSSHSAGPLGLAGLLVAIGVAASFGLLLRRRRPPSLPPGPTP